MNKYLEQADKQWEQNGLKIEKAILFLNGLSMGYTCTDAEVISIRNALLSTMMTDKPSGMFESAIESMIQG